MLLSRFEWTMNHLKWISLPTFLPAITPPKSPKTATYLRPIWMAIRLRAPCTPFWCELQRRAAATEIMMESNAPLSLLFSFAFLFRGVSNLLLTDWKQFGWIKPFRSTKYSIHVLYMDVMCVCVCARYWTSFFNLFAIYSNWIQRAFVSILFFLCCYRCHLI